jgi:signal peptidase II
VSATRRSWLRAGAVIAVVFATDQATKAIVRKEIAPGESRELLSFLDFVHVRNDGIAFGTLAGGGVIVIVIVAIALAALLAYFVLHIERTLAWLPTGLLLGGAIGNATDRARLGAVTDFVKFPHWPAFNVADSAITIGVIALLYVIERGNEAHG